MSTVRARTSGPSEAPARMRIRHTVFVEGQGVPEALEQDGRDDESYHFVVLRDYVIVGTARMRIVDGKAKAERVAVLPAHRGLGLGVVLMQALEEHAANLNHPEVTLHAQADVIGFYERLGYKGVGDRFMEADIEHLSMRKALGPA